jgi:hypothetical protein
VLPKQAIRWDINPLVYMLKMKSGDIYPLVG